MKATIYGFSEFDMRKFSYTLENVVGVTYAFDIIIITYIKDEKPITNTYNKNNVKIVIEN